VALRRLARDVAVYGSGDVVLRIATVVAIPIYTRAFTAEEYGVWNFVATAALLASAVVILGGDSAYAREYFAARSDDERRLVTSTWIAFLAVWSCGVVAVALPFSGVFSELAFETGNRDTLFALALATVPVTIVSALLGQALRNQFRAGTFAVLNAVTAVLSIGLGLVCALALDLGITGIVLGTLLGVLAVLPFRVWAVRTLLAPVFSRAVLRRLLTFGVPLVPGSIAAWVLLVSDRIVLGELSTLEELGLYSVAAGVAAALLLVVGAFGQAWSPIAIQAHETDPDGAAELFGRVLTYILVGFGTLCVLLATFAEEILQLAAPPEYHAAAAAIGPLGLGAVAYASTQVTAAGISLARRTTWIAGLATAAAALNLGLNLALVPSYGMLGSAWATAAAYGFLTLGYLVVSQRLQPARYEVRRSLTVAAATIAFTVGARYLPDPSAAAETALKVAYLVAFVVVLFALGSLDRRELDAGRIALRGLRLGLGLGGRGAA
jgi:O-antigen/teichoic acid export membrane protein